MKTGDTKAVKKPWYGDRLEVQRQIQAEEHPERIIPAKKKKWASARERGEEIGNRLLIERQFEERADRTHLSNQEYEAALARFAAKLPKSDWDFDPLTVIRWDVIRGEGEAA